MRIQQYLFVDFQNFTKIKKCWRQIIVILSIPGVMRGPTKKWARSVLPCLRLSVTNKHADRQLKYIYKHIYMKRPKREGVVNDVPFLSKEAIQTFLILFLDSMGMGFHAYYINKWG